MNVVRRVFWFLNRFFMVPAYRLGLAWLICNPIAGYIMVIKNTGRKSGKLYFTPTNYAILNGNVYCLSGFGRKAHWYLNLKAHPQVELLLPGRAISGIMEEVTDPEEALVVIKQVFRNAGFAGFFEGYNPHTAPDAKFKQTLEQAPVLRIVPVGIGSGPMDAGGWHWITGALLTLAIILTLVL
jgi:deazaflavin-dependent oxidoreductase (nitroreductase family)